MGRASEKLVSHWTRIKADQQSFYGLISNLDMFIESKANQ